MSLIGGVLYQTFRCRAMYCSYVHVHIICCFPVTTTWLKCLIQCLGTYSGRQSCCVVLDVHWEGRQTESVTVWECQLPSIQSVKCNICVVLCSPGVRPGDCFQLAHGIWNVIFHLNMAVNFPTIWTLSFSLSSPLPFPPTLPPSLSHSLSHSHMHSHARTYTARY